MTTNYDVMIGGESKDNSPMLSYGASMPASNYQSAVNWLKGKSDRPFPHGRATRVIRNDDNGIAIRYHETDVITYYPDRIVLNSGGYHTATTKARINEALRVLPVYVSLSQTSGVWYLSAMQKNPAYESDDSQPYWIQLWNTPYVDDIHIGYDGSLLNIDQEGADRENQRISDVTRLINTYIRHVMNTIDQVHATTEDNYDPDVLPLPSGGDCWDCYLHVQGTDQSLGDRIGYADPDNHLMMHLRELYIVPSLLVSALREFGSPMSRWTLQALMEGNVSSDWKIDIMKHQLKSALSRYFKIRLGIGR